MRRRFQATLLLACLTTVMVANNVTAQSIRDEGGIYIYPKIGFTQYTGDRDGDLSHLFDNNRRNAAGDVVDEPGFPWGAGLELGYNFSPSFSLGGELAWGFFPTAEAGNDSWDSYGAKLLARYLFASRTARVSPFIEGGLFGHTGVEAAPGEQNPGLAIGPLVGLGLDFAINERASVVLEWQNMIAVPDDAFDGLGNDDDFQGEEEFQRFDLLNFLSLGVKFNLGANAVAPDITDLDCPETITAGQSATFRAELMEGATEPVELRWDFGTAGATGTGGTTSYTFTTPGTYTVTATAMNEAGENIETCVVNVARAPIGASIVSLGAQPNRVSLCENQPVRFTANVAGDEPLTYSWDFGNGQTATGTNPSFTFTEAGTYTVTLRLNNAVGQPVTRTTTVVVEECEDECDDITELNSVYFPRNSSTLTAEGRAALGENLEILRECPELCVRLEGWAGAGERNPQQLSEDRARAVAQFYQDNGIAASRIATMGMGRAEGGTKKEGGAQQQRVDSIPVPCEDLNR